MFIIRAEKQTDYDAIYQVVLKAFKQAEHHDGNEQDLVDNLRKSNSFIPDLSLVAIKDNEIVGHILFTKAYVNNTEVLALAPLSVLPLFQKQGIGLLLIRKGHEIAKNLGYEFSVVLGYPQYYSKAGYIPASTYGIKAPFKVDDENFMAVCLSDMPRRLNGLIQYDKSFGVS